jgi:hypothetical protein
MPIWTDQTSLRGLLPCPLMGVKQLLEAWDGPVVARRDWQETIEYSGSQRTTLAESAQACHDQIAFRARFRGGGTLRVKISPRYPGPTNHFRSLLNPDPDPVPEPDPVRSRILQCSVGFVSFVEEKRTVSGPVSGTGLGRLAYLAQARPLNVSPTVTSALDVLQVLFDAGEHTFIQHVLLPTVGLGLHQTIDVDHSNRNPLGCQFSDMGLNGLIYVSPLAENSRSMSRSSATRTCSTVPSSGGTNQSATSSLCESRKLRPG